MRVVKEPAALQRLARAARRKGKRIGLVPTMGALHEGHLSLVRRARRENDVVIVSIFVNPSQFNRKSDLAKYPRPFAADARLARAAGADWLFAPPAAAMYPPGFQTWVEVTGLTRAWEGKFRPGHFRGVTTVVAKLFHLALPDTAYFGAKDAQQALVVRRMARDLDFDLRVRVLPTVREKDGLAMSSRNRLLSSEARRSSRSLFTALHHARRLIQCGERRGPVVVRRITQILRREKGLKIEYVAVVDPETLERMDRLRGDVQVLIAAWVGGVRLIDNEVIRCSAR